MPEENASPSSTPAEDATYEEITEAVLKLSLTVWRALLHFWLRGFFPHFPDIAIVEQRPDPMQSPSQLFSYEPQWPSGEVGQFDYRFWFGNYDAFLEMREFLLPNYVLEKTSFLEITRKEYEEVMTELIQLPQRRQEVHYRRVRFRITDDLRYVFIFFRRESPRSIFNPSAVSTVVITWNQVVRDSDGKLGLECIANYYGSSREENWLPPFTDESIHATNLRSKDLKKWG